MIFETKKVKLSSKNISVYAFSVMGEGKIENQDSFKIYSDENQVIIVVADGLGSAAYSKEGSQIITEVVIEILSNTDDFNGVYLNILNEWKKELEGNINQYDTTLKFLKIKNDVIVYGGVGDGWISIKSDKGLVNMVAENTFSNQTDSILSFNLKEKFSVNEYELSDNLVGLVSTDGFSEDMDKDNSFGLLDGIDKELASNEESFVEDTKNTLLNWPVETNRDDKTVVIFKIEEGEQHDE